MQITLDNGHKTLNVQLHIYNGVRLSIKDDNTTKDIHLTESQTKRLKDYLNNLNL